MTNPIKKTLTREEAIKLLKTRDKGRAIRIACRPFLPTANGMGIETYSLIPVSQPAAIQFVKDCLSDTLVERGAKIKVVIHKPDAGISGDYIVLGA